MKKSILTGLAVTSFMLIFFESVAGAESSKQAIGEQEFMQLIDQKKEISWRTIPANLIVNALRRSKGIWARDCIVEGDIVFQNGEVPSVSFEDTTFRGKVSFNGTTFTGQLTFSGHTTFEAEVAFDDVKFKDLMTCDGDVVFEGWFQAFQSVFFEQTRFDNVTFKRGASFNESTFHKLADFIASKFWERGPYFEKAIFLGLADFSDTIFKGEVQFDDATFKSRADFSDAQLDGESTFERVKFMETVNFSHAAIANKVSFREASFHGDTYFDKINSIRTFRTDDEGVHLENEYRQQGELLFFEASFLGRVYFDESQLNTLRLSNRTETKRYINPCIFEKRVVAQGLNCKSADFTEVEFRDYANFSGSQFTQFVSFAGATFSGEVDFYGCKFPNQATSSEKEEEIARGVLLDRARFERNVHLDYSQLTETSPWWQIWETPKLKVVTNETTTWGTLERMFKGSGNIDSQNEALYNRRLLAVRSAGADRENAIINFLSKIFWGYGVRPLRLMGWIVFVFILFAGIYWTQTKQLGKVVRRLTFALDFSWRTSFSIGYGYQHSRTTLFKVLTLTHSIGFKIMLLCWLKAVANVSPLLNDLIGKILPV